MRKVINLVLGVTINPYELTVGNGFNKENFGTIESIEARVNESLQFIVTTNFGSFSTPKTLCRSSVISIENNTEDDQLIDAKCLIQFNELPISVGDFKRTSSDAFSDFVCYFDKLGFAIEDSAMIVYLWEQTEDIEKISELGEVDLSWTEENCQRTIEYVLFRDSLNVTIDDFESVRGDWAELLKWIKGDTEGGE